MPENINTPQTESAQPRKGNFLTRLLDNPGRMILWAIISSALAPITGPILGLLFSVLSVGLSISLGLSLARWVLRPVLRPLARGIARTMGVPYGDDLSKMSRRQLENHFKGRVAKNGNFYVREFPFDMEQTTKAAPGLSWFSVGNRKDIIRCDSSKDPVVFSFETKDPALKTRLERFLKENKGKFPLMDVSEKNGIYTFSSFDPVSMADLVREVSPDVEINVERTIKSTKRYIVSGCKTWEEAKAKCLADPDGCRFVNVFSSTEDNVNGVPCVFAAGVPKGLEPLRAGEFYVDICSTEVFSDNVKVPSYSDATTEGLRSAAQGLFDQSKAQRLDDRCTITPDAVNPEGKEGVIRRYIERSGSQTAYLESSAHALDGINASIVFQFSNEKDMMQALNAGDFNGAIVLLDTTPEMTRDGYTVTIPLTEELLDKMEARERSLSAALAQNEGLDVTREGVSRSIIVDELRQNGYFTARMTDDLPLKDAKVNNVPLDVYADRLASSSTMTTLRSKEERNQWLEDASRINSAELDLDMKTKKLCLHVSYQDKDGKTGTSYIEKPLSEKEIVALSKRDLTKVAAFDLAMQCHPSLFKSYADKGNKALFSDPLGTFVQNKKPQRVDRQASSKAKAPELKTV